MPCVSALPSLSNVGSVANEPRNLSSKASYDAAAAVALAAADVADVAAEDALVAADVCDVSADDAEVAAEDADVAALDAEVAA